MSALAGGVSKEEDFYLALEVNYSKSLSDMMSLANKYARIEESRTSARAKQLKKKEAKGPDRQRAYHRASPPCHQRAPASPPRDRTRSLARRFDRYTPLTVPRTQILMEIEHQIHRPPPLRDNATRRDPTKYCCFHRDYGHDTEDYWQLQNEIE